MSWNDDVAYAMTPHKVIILPLGIWPMQKYSIFSLICFIVCSSGLAAMLIMLFLEINFGNGDANIKLDCLMLMFCAVLSVTKLLSFHFYADNMIRNFTSAVNDYIAIDTEKKRTIMRRHAYMGRMICYAIVYPGYLAAFLFLMPVILGNVGDIQVNISIKNQASELPIPLTSILESYNFSTSLYFVIIVVQYILLTLNASANVGIDAYFLAILLHVCGQMELLKIEFINYGTKNEHLIEDFSILSSRHHYLTEHAELLIDVISFVLLLQMLISCIIICLMGFQLILALKSFDPVMIFKTTSVLSALLLQLYSYSFVGDYLKCQMEDIAQSIYSCNWYSFPLKVMRHVLFVIMRSQQPVQLLAGKFFVVTVETYMTVLKTSFSYLSILRVMMDA